MEFAEVILVQNVTPHQCFTFKGLSIQRATNIQTPTVLIGCIVKDKAELNTPQSSQDTQHTDLQSDLE